MCPKEKFEENLIKENFTKVWVLCRKTTRDSAEPGDQEQPCQPRQEMARRQLSSEPRDIELCGEDHTNGICGPIPRCPWIILKEGDRRIMTVNHTFFLTSSFTIHIAYSQSEDSDKNPKDGVELAEWGSSELNRSLLA